MKKRFFITVVSLFSFYGFSMECPREKVEQCKSEKQRMEANITSKEQEVQQMKRERESLLNAYQRNASYIKDAQFENPFITSAYTPEQKETALREVEKINKSYLHWRDSAMRLMEKQYAIFQAEKQLGDLRKQFNSLQQECGQCTNLQW